MKQRIVCFLYEFISLFSADVKPEVWKHEFVLVRKITYVIYSIPFILSTYYRLIQKWTSHDKYFEIESTIYLMSRDL
jgi:hypothetical protein